MPRKTSLSKAGWIASAIIGGIAVILLAVGYLAERIMWSGMG